MTIKYDQYTDMFNTCKKQSGHTKNISTRCSLKSAGTITTSL